MKKSRLVLVLCLGLLSVDATAGRAQVFTPSYLSPREGGDLGVYLSKGPGDFALEAIWRRNLGGYDLGFRAGVADERDVAILLGAELRNPFQVEGAPVSLAFTSGVQAILTDDYTAAGFVVGVTAGQTLVPGDFSVTPYIHPRVGLVSEPRRDGDLRARILADVGVDFAFQPNLTFRIGIGIGSETSDWGIGLAWR